MGNFTNILAAMKKFLTVLSWQKLAQLLAFVLIIAFSWLGFMERDVIYGMVSKSASLSQSAPPVSLSKQSTDALLAITSRTDLVVGITVEVVNFQTNTRSVIFYTTNNPAVEDLYKDIRRKLGTELPIFTNDVNINRRIIDLINGEFTCTPFNIMPGVETQPAINKYITTVCSNGIPPFYGKFSGIINIYLKRIPTPEEMDQIRTILKTTSASIYYRDFK